MDLFSSINSYLAQGSKLMLLSLFPAPKQPYSVSVQNSHKIATQSKIEERCQHLPHSTNHLSYSSFKNPSSSQPHGVAYIPKKCNHPTKHERFHPGLSIQSMEKLCLYDMAHLIQKSMPVHFHVQWPSLEYFRKWDRWFLRIAVKW